MYLPLSFPLDRPGHYSPQIRGHIASARRYNRDALRSPYLLAPVTGAPISHPTPWSPWPCPILEFPDPRLRTKAAPVDPARVADPAFQQLVDDMFETMYEAPGIGLAASQVDVHQRFMVMDCQRGQDRPLVFINPEILAREGEQVYQEGCLSVPGIFADVTRAERDHRQRARPRRPAVRAAAPTACWRCASSTRWTTWPASCSSTTSRRSSARWCARSWPSSASRRAGDARPAG